MRSVTLACMCATAALLACNRAEQAMPTRAAAPPPGLAASASDASMPRLSGSAPPASGPIIAPAPAIAATDAQRSAGATLASQGGGGGIVACVTCHGAQGEGNLAAGFPRLAGQPYAYLLHQLASYASGTRKHPVMAPIAQAMNDAQRQAGAAYYASLPPLAGAAPASAPDTGPSPSQRAEQLAMVGDESRLLQACANCHGTDGTGGGASIPFLAGQHEAYLASALGAWRDGSRNNDPSGQMPLVAKALDSADLQAMAAFYARQPLPRTARDRDRAPWLALSAGAVVSGPRAAASQGMQGVGSAQGAQSASAAAGRP